MRITRLTAAVIVLSALFAAGCAGDSQSAPTSPVGTSGNDSRSRTVEIATPDGESLAADVVGSPGSTTTVVLAHMRGADRSTWDPIIADLTAAGYSTLAFDFRGYGDSTGTRDTRLDVDLAAAVARARSDGATKVVIIGASMGGTAVLAGGADLGVDGAVAISAPAEFLGLDGARGAAELDVPLLLIDSEDDKPYVDQLSTIGDATGADLVVFSGSAHGTAIFATHDSEITSAILTFIEQINGLGRGY